MKLELWCRVTNFATWWCWVSLLKHTPYNVNIIIRSSFQKSPLTVRLAWSRVGHFVVYPYCNVQSSRCQTAFLGVRNLKGKLLNCTFHDVKTTYLNLMNCCCRSYNFFIKVDDFFPVWKNRDEKWSAKFTDFYTSMSIDHDNHRRSSVTSKS